MADEPLLLPHRERLFRLPTSVRARWRISVATRVDAAGHHPTAQANSAWRSRAITCVEEGSGSNPSRVADVGLDDGGSWL